MRRIALFVLIVACGGPQVPPSPPPPPPPPQPPQTVASVRLRTADGSAPTLASLGAQLQLVADALDARDVSMAGVPIAWSSANTAVATVDAAGLVTAVANGTSAVSATAAGVPGTIAIMVAQAVDSVVVAPGSVLLTAKDTKSFAATALDARGHPVAGAPAAAWESSNTSVVTIDGTGLATAQQVSVVSTATIRATISGKQGTASVTVDPSAPTVASVTVTGASAALTSIGATVQLFAVARDSSGAILTGVTFSWSSSDITIATVNTTGLVTARGNGSATITASAGGKSGTRGVTVQQAVASVAVLPPTATIAVGATQIFSAHPRDAGGTDIAGPFSPVWISSNTTVATLATNVDGTATATGKSSGGPITITATVSNISGTALLTVTAPSVTVNWGFAADGTTTTIAAGSSITWHNVDSGILHSIAPDTVPPPSAAGPVTGVNDISTQTFNTPGTYHYHCGVHPTTMHGTIVVQ